MLGLGERGEGRWPSRGGRVRRRLCASASFDNSKIAGHEGADSTNQRCLMRASSLFGFG